MPYVEINYKTVDIDPEEIFKKIEQHVSDKQEKIELYYCKILRNKHKIHNHLVSIYNNKKKSIEYFEQLYIDSFFHKEKKKLWHWIKNIGTDSECFKKFGQSSRASLLLYGPPGTGKSSFAYRIAISLNRHLINLDLREIRNKTQIYQIMETPVIADLHVSYKKCVYILDEFDMIVTNLYYKDKIEQATLNNKMSKLEKNKNNDQTIEQAIEQAILNSKLEEIKDNDSQIAKKNKKYDKKKKNMIYSEDEDEDEVQNNFSDYDEEICLKDLLEIFQGPCPNDGMIIIATTNKFDEIKKMCPALFRPGRLTPVNFGHADSDIVQDISKFYFGKKLSINLPNIFNIPISHIIEIALTCKSPGNNGFEQFQQTILQMYKQDNEHK